MNRFYAPWVADGKPFRPCTPVAEVIAKFRAARPAAAKAGCFGSIGNYDHLTADVPKDHTPYSQTGWPLPSPYGVGFAVDIMHRPDLGVDCHVIFKHWLAEAKAGRLPWLKYLIWQGKSYSVRNNWEPRDADGHFDHVHASTRTDHVNTHIGDFDPLGDDMPTEADWKALTNRVDTIIDMDETNPFGDSLKPEPNKLASAIKAIAADLADVKAKVDNPPPVALSEADRAAIVADLLVGLRVPTAEENAAAFGSLLATAQQASTDVLAPPA
jgi:hypothetical protein